MDFSQINFIAVAVAGVAAWLLGSLWYTVLFGKLWQKESGINKEDVKDVNMGLIFGTSAALMIFMALGLAFMVQAHAEAMTWKDGMIHGLLVGAFFAAPTIGVNYLYQRQTFMLWVIDSLYTVIFLGIEGAILGAWH